MKILFNFIFLITFITCLNAEVVNDVNVKGNQRISKETIIVLGKINLSEDYNDNKLNQILKNLYESKFFSDIDITISNGTLIINVLENPIISDIRITGIKNKSILDNLTNNISSKNRTSYSEDTLNSDLNLIRNILKSGGYYFAKIKPSTISDKKLNSIELIIDIDLGEKAKIKQISFVGDKKIKDKNFLKLLRLRNISFGNSFQIKFISINQ